MKYKFTDETMTTDSGVVLHRIECVTAFEHVEVGDKGGWIEKKENLSQSGYCWVDENARVCGDAKVYGDAMVFCDAQVYGDAKVYDDAMVFGDAQVYGDAKVYDDAIVCGDAQVYGDARVCGYAKVYGDAMVCGDAQVYGDARVCGDAVIENGSDYIVFKNNWSSGRYFTWTRSNDMWRVGCFSGTGEQLIEKAYKDSKLSGDHYKAYVELVEKLKELQK